MNFDKESKSIEKKNFLLWDLGGGGGGGGGHILYTRHIVMPSSTEPYSLMKIFLEVFKIEGTAALTIKGRLFRKYKNELSFLFYIRSIMIIFQTVFKLPSRGNNSRSMKARVVILVRYTLSWPVLPSCEESWLYSKGYSSYRVDMKLHLKWSRGNNSESMTARVAILVCDISSWPVLHNSEVSSKYSK